MKSINRERLTMYRIFISFHNKHMVVLNNIPGWKETVHTFIQNKELIEEKFMITERTTKGETLDKRNREEKLFHLLSNLKNLLQAHAVNINSFELLANANLKINRIAGNDLIAKARSLRAAIDKHLPDLAQYPNAPTPTSLAEFDAALTDFYDHLTHPAFAEGRIKAANQMMQEAFSANGHLMSFKFKTYIKTLRRSHPDTYNAFFGASKIQKPATTPTALRGKILDPQGKPLFGATIEIKSARKSTRSTKLGNYKFFALPKGKHTITMTCLGFHTITTTITIPKGKATLLNFTLNSIHE